MDGLTRLARYFGLWNSRRASPTAAVLIYLLGCSTLYAQGVTIEGEHPAQSINISVDKVSIGAVLQALHDKYGIEVSGVDDTTVSNDPISVTLSGNLPSILERLLRNQNYLIVRSRKNVTGVEKILISAVTHDDASKNPPANDTTAKPPPQPPMP
jgi:hypothetical protein